MSRIISNKVAWGILLPFLLIIGLLIINKTAVQDWWHFYRYTPPAEILLLADSADFSDQANKLFFRASPELISKARLDKLCLNTDNLGCLVTGPKIYILQFKQEELTIFNQAVVTAAHEMLHMAYFRLGEEKKSDLKALIDQALESRVKDSRVKNILDKTTTDEEYYDEAHSLLGSEVDFLQPELEEHYRQYFDDRDEVLKAFNKSKGLL